MTSAMKQQKKVNTVGKFFIDANFYLAVIVLLYGGFTAISETYSVFKFNEELYGAIHSNLRIALLYMAMSGAVVIIYSAITRQARFMLFLGCFLLMMLGSLEFYGKVNGVPFDSNLSIYFLYTGISHVLFGWLSGWEGFSVNGVNK